MKQVVLNQMSEINQNEEKNDPLFLRPIFIAYFCRLLFSTIFEHFGLIGFSPDYFEIKIFRVVPI